MKMKLISFLILCTLLLMPTIASAEVANDNVGYGEITSGRLWAIVSAIVGLISVVMGGLSLARSAGRFGTGNGRSGAVIAAVIGLIGMVLAGLTLVRSRRVG